MEEGSCLKNLLKLINILQTNSTPSIDEGCERPFLGPITNSINYNTRVITLYNRQGSLITPSYGDSTSPYLRVESVGDNSAIFRILSLSDGTYSSTNTYITINLGCICAIQCLDDVLVENL